MIFKDFLLNESKHYLGQRSGDILQALQSLNDDANGMGNRTLMRVSESIVNQIRRILHGRWDDEDVQHLKKLQKVGVALMKAIDENGDMPEVIASSVAELEGMLNDLQMPINSLGSESPPEQTTEDGPLARGTQLGV